MSTHSDWCRCDGRGNEAVAAPASAAPPPTPPVPPLSRRQALFSAGLGAVGWLARGRSALANVTVSPEREAPAGDVLVVLFLRGGADGLNIVTPYAEDGYHRRRPTIGLASPRDNRAAADARLLDLDGFFGLHPNLAPLHPFYRDGSLAVVHACGSADRSHSHFEAMSAMERGAATARAAEASGWLARHLASTAGHSASPLRAVAFSNVMPDSLRGATDATALNSLADFRLFAPGEPGGQPAPVGRDALRHSLMEFYRDGTDAVAVAGRETLAVLETLNRIDPAHYRPAHGAVYPAGDLGSGLRQVAFLIKARVGLEVACLDRGGWDTHVAQNTGGILGLSAQLTDLGQSLAAFARDLGPGMQRVTVVAMTEFGRRVQENSGLGTDHGRGSVMLLMGGAVHGGKVHGRWPGLEDDQLEEPGDLRVTTDYRDVLSEVLARRAGNRHIEQVFGSYQPDWRSVVRA